MTLVVKVLRPVGQVLKLIVMCAAGLLLAGAAYATATGSGLKFSLASALFLGGAAIFVSSALSGGGARGRRADLYAYGRLTRMTHTDMSFGWVLVGLALIGLGALTVAL